MSKKVLHALYFADDKDIYDLLAAARQRLTPQKLVDIARTRGVLLSPSDDRDALVEELALMPFGWLELQKLIEATETAERAEKTTNRTLAGSFDLDRIRADTEKVRDSRAARGETFTIERTQKSLRVRVTYSDVDPTSTRLLQRTRRDFTLEFEPGDTTTLVRHQDQPRAGEVIKAITEALAVATETRIELSGVRDHRLRTDFFMRIIRGVDGFKFEDLKSVRASPLPKDTAAGELAADQNDGEDDGGDEADESDEIAPAKAEFVAKVQELALTGDAIHQTQQYQSLDPHGLFVRAVKWTATEIGTGGENVARFEFEAGFDNDEATNFTYSVRAKYERRPSDNDFKKTKSPVPVDEKTRLLRLIEGAAVKAMNDVVVLARSEEGESANDGQPDQDAVSP